MALPPKYWPTSLWVAVGAAALLALHAIGLAIQLVLVHVSGGVPENMDAPDAPPVAPIVESYSTQIIFGAVPAMVILGVGLWAAVFTARLDGEGFARSGRVLLGILGLLAVALIALALPWLL